MSDEFDGRPKRRPRVADAQADHVAARCLCGSVALDIGYPAFWAWHDHGRPSRRAHGAAYATYVGTWKKRFRVVKGGRAVRTYLDEETGDTRAFCGRCGTPVWYKRRSAPKWINIPRALFDGRTGREPRYHLNFSEMQDWAFAGAPLVPLKGYPGVMYERPKRRKRHEPPPMF